MLALFNRTLFNPVSSATVSLLMAEPLAKNGLLIGF